MGGGANPFIADEGRDGHPFCHFDFVSDDGAWAWFLIHAAHSITVMPDMTDEQPLDAVEGRPDAPGAAVQSPFHDTPNSPEAQDDHAG